MLLHNIVALPWQKRASEAWIHIDPRYSSQSPIWYKTCTELDKNILNCFHPKHPKHPKDCFHPKDCKQSLWHVAATCHKQLLLWLLTGTFMYSMALLFCVTYGIGTKVCHVSVGSWCWGRGYQQVDPWQDLWSLKFSMHSENTRYVNFN